MGAQKQESDALDARLARCKEDLAQYKAGAWIRKAREDAEARLRAMGLPGRRDEYWRFTRPDLLAAPEPAAAEPFETDESLVFDEIDRLKIVFTDGRFDPRASDDLTKAGEGIEVTTLLEAAEADLHWAQDLFGRLEAEGQSPVPRPLAALNTACARNGVLIRVTGKVTRPVSLIYRHYHSHSDAMLHHVVRLEEGASLTLLENGPGGARFNSVLEVDVADGAAFDHVRAQGRDHGRVAATHLFARLGAKSALRSFTLTANGRLTRNEAVVTFTGDDALAHLAGAAVGDGNSGDFHHDDTIFITHGAERCESRQVFKKVLMNGAVGVFQGKILVRQGAQKTDGYQMSQALMLDGDSQFLAKPELEIYADDVACSHGSTTGAIDEEALFYLRSRGVPRKDAENLLVLAFLEGAVEEIADEVIADDIRLRLQGWVERRG